LCFLENPIGENNTLASSVNVNIGMMPRYFIIDLPVSNKFSKNLNLNVGVNDLKK
jgi:hypothetical protein